MPAPSAEETQWSARLAAVIREEIGRAGGVIPFSRFMELALYDPRYGYYVSGSRKLGEWGDFVTAPELGDLFAGSLLNLVAYVLECLGGGDVLELGAGSGTMAAQLLAAMKARSALPDRYLILDIGGDLKQRQLETIRSRVPECLPRLSWISELPGEFRGVVLANEVADALPFDRFGVYGGAARGIGVAWQGGAFADAHYTLEETVREQLTDLDLGDDYRSEISLYAQAWMATLCRSLAAGVILIVDYGYPARELYHPMRREGTLMCHYRHRAHTDPYWYVGLQDITAHVDFTALARSACEAGQSVLGFTTQASFLISLGLLELIETDGTEIGEKFVSLSQQAKRLTLPSEMGETFKALAVGRNVPSPLPGFSFADQRHRL